ncbi:MIP/aquaporin family protein [Chlorobaculum sp. 24CR]|uniref:MIP/aquaporin family protein n=1 Tax=Chlorobaculum sp. 24CR TaxID=2508878 RepID=UPI001FD68CBE|nr:aquaporin [Chlorobaculum sp. 24CR]
MTANNFNCPEAERDRMLLTQLAPNFLDPKHEWQRIFAELWGAFLLVLVAAGGPVAVAGSGNHSGDALLPVAPGLMVMAIIYFMGTVSGAHLNPAVTIAFAIRRNFPWIRVPGYIIAQITGGWLAALFLGFMFGDGAVAAGMTLPGHGITPPKALAMEAVLTAALVNTILGTSSGARNIGTNGAIAVGGYIALAGMWAGPVSGASMNPVRSLAPALVCGDTALAWIYVAGPLSGALIGVVFEWILKGPPTTSGAIAAQGTLDIDDNGDNSE